MLLQQSIADMPAAELFDTIYRDFLTGVLNRRAFDKIVSPREPVAIVDLDSLKYLNDQFGHRNGDAHLVALAECWNSTPTA